MDGTASEEDVVLAARIGIAQDGVRLADFGELLLSARFLVDVWMEFAREGTEGAVDLVQFRDARDAEDGVEVFDAAVGGLGARAMRVAVG